MSISNPLENEAAILNSLATTTAVVVATQELSYHEIDRSDTDATFGKELSSLEWLHSHCKISMLSMFANNDHVIKLNNANRNTSRSSNTNTISRSRSNNKNNAMIIITQRQVEEVIIIAVFVLVRIPYGFQKAKRQKYK